MQTELAKTSHDLTNGADEFKNVTAAALPEIQLKPNTQYDATRLGVSEGVAVGDGITQHEVSLRLAEKNHDGNPNGVGDFKNSVRVSTTPEQERGFFENLGLNLRLTGAVAASIAALASTETAKAQGTLYFDSVDGASFSMASPLIDTFNGRGELNGDPAAAFMGNGGTLSTVGVVVGIDATGPNTGNLSSLQWQFNYWTGTGDFQSDPYGQNRPPGMAAQNLTPVNASWQTPIGQAGAYNLYYLQFNVSSLNLVTTPGQEELASIFGVGGNTTPLVALSSMRSGGGGMSDWYSAGSDIGHDGIGSLTSQGYASPFAAYEVTETPEPSTIALLAVGAGTYLLLRKNRISA